MNADFHEGQHEFYGVTVNRIYYLLIGMVLIFVLIALLFAAKTHEETVHALPDILAIEMRQLLTAERVWDIKIESIHTRIEELKKEYPYIESIILRKIYGEGRISTLYPFAYDWDHPDFPPEKDDSYFPNALMGEDGSPLGVLYVKIKTGRLRSFNAAILGSMAALIIVSILGLYTIQSKDQEVRKTTSLLGEKQRELIRLERLSLVGQVTANLLHDLKKPVLNIRAESESLPTGGVRNAILEETDLFLRMIRELRLEGFLRQDLEHAEFADLGDILDRSLRLVKYARNNVRVLIDLPEDLPFLFGQRHQLIQIFSNILLNDFQALEGNGTILINAAQIEEDGKPWLETHITDDGPGMSFDVLAHIFEPFYSTRKTDESAGLGLYITKSIIETMGGVIQVKSIPKHGATFTLRFPITPEEEV